MGILEWISVHKELIAAIGGGCIFTYRFALFIHKKLYRPAKTFLDRVNYEINNNGGKSMKDLIERSNIILNKIVATQDAMLSISDQCIFKCDENGYCTFANEALCDLYGATLEDMIGFGWINFIKENEREAAERNWKRAIQQDKQITYNYTIVHGDTGIEQPCYYRAAIKRDADNKIISILGVVFKK